MRNVRHFVIALAAWIGWFATWAASEAQQYSAIHVDMGGFCGQWRLLPDGESLPPVYDPTCATALEPEFRTGNCTVEMGVGGYELQIRGNRRPNSKISVSANGDITVPGDRDRIALSGGPKSLTLRTRQVKVDLGGWAGAAGLENVRWSLHPRPECNADNGPNDAWWVVPEGGSFLTNAGAILTIDHHGQAHSSKTTSMQVKNDGTVVFLTGKVLVYPIDKASGSIPWEIFEGENYSMPRRPLPGQREIVAIKDNDYMLRITANNNIRDLRFNFSAECRLAPSTVQYNNARFRLVAICR
jgi:hypothetical protein